MQTIIKKRSPQNMEFDAKGLPKWSQNRYQNSSKTNAKTCNEQIMKIITNNVSLNGKFIEIHNKKNAFDGLKGDTQNMNIHQTSDQKRK